ncbi:hypothetical protein G6689_02335 [Polynucleobacter paneuropaeus]|nr:hypothetical protein G6704_02760 [Polynucleobacter paneuropaeus]QWD20222.1 hypothetical protein G6689_02335 [Polynucleobacter paneuropaeus]
MSTSALLVLLLWVINPEPFLVQSMIDSAKILGLPRLKTMDKLLAKTKWGGDFQDEIAYATYSRIEFLQKYVKSRKGS